MPDMTASTSPAAKPATKASTEPATEPAAKPTTVDDYLSGVGAEARIRIDALRSLVHESAPCVVESLAYGMPTFAAEGRHRFHVAAWSKHVGIYPVQPAPDPLERELAPLRAAKDTVQLRFRDPLDEGLLSRLVEFLLERPTDG